MIKYLFAILVVAALLGAGYYNGVGQGGATVLAHDMDVMETADDTHEQAVKSSWTFAEAGEKDGVPQTRVSYDVHGTITAVGTFEGHCADMKDSAWTMRDGAADGAVCWFAGGGTEIGVFHEGDKHVIKTAILDEGTAATAGIRGEMTTLLAI